MAIFPLSSNFEKDFVIQLVPVDDQSTMDEVAQACAYHSVGRRVAAQDDKVLRVRQHSTGKVFPREMKLADAGLMPTETVDIIFSDV